MQSRIVQSPDACTVFKQSQPLLQRTFNVLSLLAETSRRESEDQASWYTGPT